MRMTMTKATVEELSLEDLAMEYDHRLDVDGELVQWGTLNNAKLKENIRRLNQEGERVMQPFITWLIERYGDRTSNARLRALIAWRALVENRDDPAGRLFERGRYSHVQRLVIRLALSRFATWMIENAPTQQDLDYAKNLANRIATVPACQKIRDTQRKCQVRVPTTLFANAEIDQIFAAIEERHALYEAKRPWARAVTRLVILSGIVGNVDFFLLERDNLLEELAKHERGEVAAVAYWGMQHKSRQIPITIAYHEFRALADWPWPWGVLGDLVSPNSKDTANAANTRVREELKKVFLHAGLPWDRRSGSNLNKTIRKRIWDASHDYLLMQSMFGFDMRATKGKDYLAIPIATF